MKTALAQRLAGLPFERQRLLLQAIESDGGPRDLHPVSFSQERLWFLHQLAPAGGLYNLTAPVELDGPADVAALAAGLRALTRRHQVLRSRFLTLGGRPIQAVEEDRPVPVAVVDLQALPAAVAERRARRVAQQDAATPFDLANGPLLRATLVRLAPERHLLLLTLHHIVADGWSVGILLAELAALAAAARGGRRAELPDLPIQYHHYARWQRRELAAERLAPALAHWRERLAELPPELALPTDRPRPAVPSFRGGVRPLRLGAGGAALGALAAAQGATPFMAMLAAWLVLLGRYTGQTDLVVGTVVANRGRAELEPLIGCFVNTLVLRTSLAGDPPFTELLARTRQVCVEAFAHQDVPFEKLVDALHPERSVGRSPLFQVAFDLQNLPGRPAAAATGAGGGGAGEAPAFDGATGTAKFDLRLLLTAGLDGVLEYAADLFDAVTAARLTRHLAAWVEAIAAAPGRRLSQLAPLAPEERQAVLHEANDSGPQAPWRGGAYAGFAAAAARRPRAAALACGGESLTWGELARRAERLAAQLLRLGAGAAAPVGICLERSLDLPAAVLACLAAGAPYVPLDPGDPAERRAALCGEAGVRVLLARPGGEPAGAGGPVVMPLAHRTLAELAGERRTVAVAPGDLAYIIFTSGSTGRPKGVAVTHGGLANYLAWCVAAYALDGGAGSLLHTSFCFDLTVTALLAPLVAGRPVRLLQDDSPAALAEALRAAPDFSLLKLTPGHLDLLAAQLDGGSLAGCARCLVVGGEALTARALAPWRRHAPATRLINEYGPTETVVGCCVHQVAAGEAVADAVPIGRPIPGLTLHLLDAAGEPVPLGAPGEIHIGGAGVAQGYAGRPELTAGRFLPDPFGPPGARLYRTGDLGRRRADGCLVYLGRTDHQLKVRGFRVEPGEIEAAIAGHPGVAQAVVVAEGATAGERRLAAYVVPQAAAALAPRELRERLQALLPRHLQPSHLTLVEALPLTRGGKLDRAALAALRAAAPAARPADGRLRDATEQAVAEVWRELLGVGQVDRRDSFFDLGGHSLLLLEMQTRLRQRLAVELSLLELFQNPTVEALAGLLHRRLSGAEKAAGAARDSAPAAPAAARPAAGGSEPIAVVGLALRVPGAGDPDAFWRNLRDGVESVTFWSEAELRDAGVPANLLADPRYVRGKASLPGIDLFDAGFFRLAPKQAALLDPQHRVFLECSWEALERAGYGSAAGRGRTGVFAGAGAGVYALGLQANAAAVGSFTQANLANDKDHLTTRTAYLLALEGPAITVQTACSTSLVAVHLACQSLRQGECELALAGGVSLDLEPVAGYLHQASGILSPDGHCRPFDARARGTVGGSGCGVVVLKRLAQALADGDTVQAVILGSAVNNDGAAKAGYTAPRADGQAQAIRAAHAAAGVRPADISYLETHGTGTELGDPIELAGLRLAFADAPPAACTLGSVKANIGHLDTASGVVGLIKTVLALAHRQLPPSFYFDRPNPSLDLAASPFRLDPRLADWCAGDAPRRAGVSSFGIGGTNAHVVLEEAPAAPAALAPAPAARAVQLLVLSARSAAALDAATDRLAAHLRRDPGIDLAGAAFTLQAGRSVFAHRRVVIAAAAAEAAGAMERRDPALLADGGGRDGAAPPPVFLFPGQGEQAAGMGRELYAGEPLFRDAIDRCAEILHPALGLDLRRLLYPDAAAHDQAAARLADTALAQPALFATEYALARLWMSWTGEPAAMLGHSLGEYVAACLAGVFDLDAALRLVAERGRLMAATAPGAMLAVELGRDQVAARLRAGVAVAAINGAARTVVSGDGAAVAALAAELGRDGVRCRPLPAARGFHSPLMEPILAAFGEAVRRADPRPPRLPWLSNLTGTWASADEVTRADYWVEHLRRPVRFADGLDELWRRRVGVPIEIGPGRTLTALARRHAGRPPGGAAVAALPRPGAAGEQRALVAAVGEAWLAGVEIDWPAFAGGRRRRIPLPTYPFERARHWIGPAALPSPTAAAAAGAGNTGAGAITPPPVAEATWIAAGEPPAPVDPAAGPWLVLSDGGTLAGALVERLRQARAEVVVAHAGVRYAARQDGDFTVDPSAGGDLAAVVAALAARGRLPGVVAHLWSAAPDAAADFAAAQERGPGSLRRLAAALRAAAAAGAPGAGGTPSTAPARIGVVTQLLHDVLGGEAQGEERAAVLAFVQDSRGGGRIAIDVAPPAELHGEPGRWLLDRLIAELAGGTDAVVAYRGWGRWVRAARELRAPAVPRPWSQGVYLVGVPAGGDAAEAAFGCAGAVARAAGCDLVLAGIATPAAGPAPIACDLSGAGAGAAGAELAALESELAERLAVRLLGDREGLADGLSRLCALHAVACFRGQGIDVAGGRYSLTDLRRQLRLLPAFERFGDALLAWMAADGWIERRGEAIELRAGAAPEAGALAAEIVARHPEVRGMVSLLGHCAAHLGRALCGEVPALAVLYPEGRSDVLDAAGRDSAAINHEELYVRLLARFVGRLAGRQQRPLRILEVGGGTGSLTRVMMQELAGQRFSYTFTDLGPTFVRAAERRAAAEGLSELSFQVFDIGREPAAQGLCAGAFDVVVGLNVVHAAADLEGAVGNLRRLLAPGGLLGLIETVLPSRWVDLVWGLTEGWWAYTDARRTLSPLVPPEVWEEVLRAAGLGPVVSLPRARPLRQDIGLILGQWLGEPAAPQAAAGRQAAATPQAEHFTARAQQLAALAAQCGARLDSVVVADDPAALRQAVAAAARRGTLRGLVWPVAGSIPAGPLAAELDRLTTAGALDFALLNHVPAGGAGDRAAGELWSAFARRRRQGGEARLRLARWRSVPAAAEADDLLPRLVAHAVPEMEVWPASAAAAAVPAPAAAAAAAAAAAPGAEAAGGASAISHASAITHAAAAADDVAAGRWGGQPAPVAPGLHAAAAPGPHATAAPTEGDAPRGEIERLVAALWQELLGCAAVGRADNFFALGGDSLVALGLAARLRDALGLELPMRRLLEAPSLAALAEWIEEETARSRRQARRQRDRLPANVIEIQPGQRGRLPFFTVHAAGGNVLCYYKLARCLGRERPVYALEAPGLAGGGRTFHRLEELAAYHVEAVRRVQPAGPYLLGGWSAGGTVAFEMASQLARLGETAQLVALMDTYAPKSGAALDELQMLLWQVWRFGVAVTPEELQPLAGFEAQLDLVVARAVAQGVVPPEVDREQATRLLRTELATLQAMLNYRPPRLDVPLIYFRCAEKTDFGGFERLWPHINQIDHAAGWAEQSGLPMPVHVVPGHHADLMDEPGVAVMASHLAAAIAAGEDAPDAAWPAAALPAAADAAADAAGALAGAPQSVATGGAR